MGLMDILNGMQNGPRGQRQPSGSGSGSSGGMSPMTMALLGLLAYKAINSGGLGNILGGGQAAPSGGGGHRAPDPDDTIATSGAGGGLGDLLGSLLGGGQTSGKAASNPADLLGGLGGLLGGASAGNVLSSGLGGLIRDLQSNGQGRIAQSWVGTGANQDIDPGTLENSLGAETLEALERQSGMNRDELLQGLSDNLPDLVDRLTPNGRLPTEEEASRWV